MLEHQFRIQQQLRAAALLHTQMLQFYQNSNHPHHMQANQFNNQFMRPPADMAPVPSTSSVNPKNTKLEFLPTSVMRQMTKNASGNNSMNRVFQKNHV